MRQRVVLDRFRSTDGATKLKETQKTGTALARFNKPHEPELTAVRRYRTQEVAGSSPASSIHKLPANGPRTLRSAVGEFLAIYQRATKMPDRRNSRLAKSHRANAVEVGATMTTNLSRRARG